MGGKEEGEGEGEEGKDVKFALGEIWRGGGVGEEKGLAALGM